MFCLSLVYFASVTDILENVAFLITCLYFIKMISLYALMQSQKILNEYLFVALFSVIN